MPLAIQVEDVTSPEFMSKHRVAGARDGHPRASIGDLFPE